MRRVGIEAAVLALTLSFLVLSCSSDAIGPSDADTISLLVVSGAGQSGVVGAELPQPLVVKATRPSGSPLGNIVVNFHVTSGGGSVFAGAAITDAKGTAEDYWTLGTSTATPQRVEVRAVLSNGQKQVFGTFTATPLAGSPARIAIQAGDGQTVAAGATVPIPPAVAVTDQYGNPVPSVAVAFSVTAGGGSVTGAAATTNAAGIAAVGSWSLGSTAGTNSLVATAAGSAIAGNPVGFTATAVAPVVWTTVAPLPTPRNQAATGTINGVLYVVGGVDNNGQALGSVEAYDPTTNTWTERAPLPTPRSYLAAGVIDGVLYAVSGLGQGFSAVGTVEAYDPVTNAWSSRAAFPEPNWGMEAGVINGILYVTGGANGPSTALYAYDPSTDSWSAKAPLPAIRVIGGAGVVGGNLYIVGGLIDGATLGTSVLTYNPGTNSWSTKAAIPTPRGYLAAGVVNGLIYVVGGVTFANGASLTVGSVEAYDPTTDSWTVKTPLPMARNGLAAGVVNGVLYAMSGTAGGGVGLDGTVLAYQPGRP